MFLFEKILIMYLRVSFLINRSLFWRIISDAISSCSSSLSVVLRVKEEDLDRILVFLVVFFSLIELFLHSGISGDSMLKMKSLGDKGEKGRVDSSAGLLILTWFSYEVSIF